MQANQWARVLVVAGAWALTGAAQAAAACGSGTLGTGTLSTANVVINTHEADNCIGVVVDNLNEQTDLSGVFGGGWSYVAEGQIGIDDSGSFGGYTVTLDAIDGDSFLLTLAPDVALPKAFDLMIGLKASNRYAMYFFDDEPLSASNDGSYVIGFQSNGGQIAQLSHLALIMRDGSGTIEQNGVPEPGTLALLAVGLLAAGARRRKG